MSRYCSQIVTVLGMIVLVLGVVTIYYIVPNIEEKLYNKIVSLQNGSYTFKHWMDPKIPAIYRIYFFQVRNQSALNDVYYVKEVGPYVYHKYERKSLIDLNEREDTMTYAHNTVYFFNETESGGRKDTDVITVLDPLVAAYLQEYARFPEFRQPNSLPTAAWYGDQQNPGVSSPDDGRLFITTTVKDFLFGERYFKMPTDPNDTSWDYFSAIMNQMKGRYLQSYESTGYVFRLLKRYNNTLSPSIVIRRGTVQKLSKGAVVSYANRTKMSIWESHVCAMINGTNLSVLPSMSKIPKMIYSFAFEFCRSISFKFEQMMNVFGLTGAKFVRDKRYMELSEENECFCPHYRGSENPSCPPNGVMSLKKCYGIDLFNSEPHFYSADPNLYEHDTKGLAPRKDRHQSYIVVEPKSGVILLRKTYFQINARFTQHEEWGSYYAPLRSGMYPIVWSEEEYRVPPEEKEHLEEAFHTIYLMYIMKWFLVILGMVLLILSVVLVMYEEEIICTKRRSEKMKLNVFQMRNRRTR